ncbi:MAG: hypothetical protein JNK72_14480 [Myxococcales bacterium]|nr:hypothetical protein [Myxococcales bacterium]
MATLSLTRAAPVFLVFVARAGLASTLLRAAPALGVVFFTRGVAALAPAALVLAALVLAALGLAALVLAALGLTRALAVFAGRALPVDEAARGLTAPGFVAGFTIFAAGFSALTGFAAGFAAFAVFAAGFSALTGFAAGFAAAALRVRGALDLVVAVFFVRRVFSSDIVVGHIYKKPSHRAQQRPRRAIEGSQPRAQSSTLSAISQTHRTPIEHVFTVFYRGPEARGAHSWHRELVR